MEQRHFFTAARIAASALACSCALAGVALVTPHGIAQAATTAVRTSAVSASPIPNPRLASSFAEQTVDAVPTPDGNGFWMVDTDGGVSTEGDAVSYGDISGLYTLDDPAAQLNAPIVGMAATRGGGGYWIVGADGGVFSFGDAQFYGSTGDPHLNAPIVQIVSTPDSRGYWLVASDGGVFSFGDASFYGSTGNLHLNATIVGMASAPNGDGYWLVGSDGGVFSFGDAPFYGSTGGLKLDAPIVNITATNDGAGYWMVGDDGGVFTFGDAHFAGSAANYSLYGAVSLVPTGDDGGYWIVGDETFLPLGDATLFPPPGQAPSNGFGDAKAEVLAADNADAADQPGFWIQAALDLEYGEIHDGGDTSGYSAAASALVDLSSLPDTDVSPAQIHEGAADAAIIDSFFGF
jgi:hypothetical protein